jgi:RimJ/RimL family protein N-acetyltransferase
MRLDPVVIEGRLVRLEPFTAALREAVRAALDCDAEGWAIVSSSAHGEHFDGWWRSAEAEMAAGTRIPFAVRRQSDGAVIGTTSFMTIRPSHRGVEIGATFYRPDARGGLINPQCKRLLLAHAFEAGALRVELVTDARNLRSQAAIAKLGAVREGVLRRHKVTWTGHVRDTVMFAVTDLDWPAVRDGLDERLATSAAPGRSS